MRIFYCRLDENAQHSSAISLPAADDEQLARDEEKEVLNRGLFVKTRIDCASDKVSIKFSIWEFS